MNPLSLTEQRSTAPEGRSALEGIRPAAVRCCVSRTGRWKHQARCIMWWFQITASRDESSLICSRCAKCHGTLCVRIARIRRDTA